MRKVIAGFFNLTPVISFTYLFSYQKLLIEPGVYLTGTCVTELFIELLLEHELFVVGPKKMCCKATLSLRLLKSVSNGVIVKYGLGIGLDWADKVRITFSCYDSAIWYRNKFGLFRLRYFLNGRTIFRTNRLSF